MRTRSVLALTTLICSSCTCGDEVSGDPPDSGATSDAGPRDLGLATDGGILPDAATEDATSSDLGASDVGTVDSGLTTDAGPFAPNPRFSGLAPGEAMDLGQFTCAPVPGEDPDLCRRTTDYGGFVYDPHRHQMVMFGGGHSTTMTDAVHVLDLGGSLTWSDLYLPTPCSQMTAGNLGASDGAWLAGPDGPFPRPVSSHTYDMLAVPPTLDELVVISRNFTGGYCNVVGNDIGGKIAHFDRRSSTWSFSPTAEGTGNDLSVNLPGSEPDPISGRVVLLGRGGLGVYDPSSKEYALATDTLLDANGDPISVDGYANHLTYFPPDDRFYFFARGAPVRVWALTFDRANPAQSILEAVTTTGPSSPHSEPGYDYDSVNQVIGGGVIDDTFYTFDPATRAWAAHPIQGGTPGAQAFHALAFDPVDGVFVFVTGYDDGARTWAFRL